MTLGSHQATVGKSQVHITPRWIIDALGPFDLDPCAADPRPWDCAVTNYSCGGLMRPWHGFVWLNPPFDRYQVSQWINRLAAHGSGIALLHARTETAWFVPCWQRASGIFFLAKRIAFCRPDGSTQPANSGAPPVLVAFGPVALQTIVDAMQLGVLRGVLVREWEQIGGCQHIGSLARGAKQLANEIQQKERSDDQLASDGQ